MERYVCIHGHFYQPPRENPWLETIELQDSAAPYHDWNERVTAECYAPNAASRILSSDGRIAKIVNNYAGISFDFGPTLLAWMEEHVPDTYRALLDADRQSRQRFSGHGSAMAQAYNHIILPLANRRDKYTQVLWGIRDFESRFGRRPEGMWLPETAVDLETLDILAQLGIRFTLLAPRQAHRVRPLESRGWCDVSEGRIDPSTAYLVRLPSGRAIAAFFYDDPISRGIAFEDLLNRGESLAGRLVGAFHPARTWPQIAHIATDGETYGHHRHLGDMALAYALHHIEENRLATFTNYGEYLERHPPAYEVQIFENSSWSCVHGVERWRANCGCNSGLHPGWNQKWRTPLRQALDWLRDRLAPRYQASASQFFTDPWAARDDYISVVLDRSPESVNAFFHRHESHRLDQPGRVAALKLLEMQRHTMLMYTSCGWFFDELSGLETVQVIQYAGRALQLAEDLFGDSLETEFLGHLERAGSNLPEHRNGRRIYEKFVKPAVVDLLKVGAHYAVSSLFEDYSERSRAFCYTVEREDHKVLRSGNIAVALGHARIASTITGESAVVTYGVLHLGDQNVFGGVREYRGRQAYGRLAEKITGLFERGDLPQLVHMVDQDFGSGTYTLRMLFHDQQRKIVGRIIQAHVQGIVGLYRRVYAAEAPIVRLLRELHMPVPACLQTPADTVVDAELREALAVEEPDLDRIQGLLQESVSLGASLDGVTLEFVLRRTLERWAERFRRNPADAATLESFTRVTALTRSMPFETLLRTPQNAFYEVLEQCYSAVLDKALQGDEDSRRWLSRFTDLGTGLGVMVPECPDWPAPRVPSDWGSGILEPHY